MIYFLAPVDRSRIKIGTTIRLSARLRQLASEHGELEVLAVVDGGYAQEAALHRRFVGLRTMGEWFEAGADLLGYIAAEGRPWDGIDESPASSPARVDAQVARMAKLVASEDGKSLSDYLSDLLRPQVGKDYRRVVKAIGEGGEA